MDRALCIRSEEVGGSIPRLPDMKKKIKGYTLKEWKTVIFWRILKHSFIFRLWYRAFLSDLLFELERFDIDGEKTTKKYLEKYNKFK